MSKSTVSLPRLSKPGGMKGAPGSDRERRALCYSTLTPCDHVTGLCQQLWQSVLFSNIKLGKGVKAQVEGGWTSEFAMVSGIQYPWQMFGTKILMFLEDNIKCSETYLPFMRRMSLWGTRAVLSEQTGFQWNEIKSLCFGIDNLPYVAGWNVRLRGSYD